MLRDITAFHLDDHGDWVAVLGCGHGQHVRHRPPFWSCPWVQRPEGRAEKIATPLPCPLCDRFEMPAGFASYKRTPDFTQDTIPAALRKSHSTKPGVWALIHVMAGRLRYVVESPLSRDEILMPVQPGVVVAEALHHVEPDGDVTFFVEFHRAT